MNHENEKVKKVIHKCPQCGNQIEEYLKNGFVQYSGFQCTKCWLAATMEVIFDIKTA